MLQEEKVALTSSIQESIDLVYAGLSNQCSGIVFGAIKETRLSSLITGEKPRTSEPELQANWNYYWQT